jgi:hypothetical protein
MTPAFSMKASYSLYIEHVATLIKASRLNLKLFSGEEVWLLFHNNEKNCGERDIWTPGDNHLCFSRNGVIVSQEARKIKQ